MIEHRDFRARHAGARRQELKNSDWSRWYLVPDGGRQKIKRCRVVDGVTKWERYPAQKYLDLGDAEIKFLLRQINASYTVDRQNAEARYDFHHAYINVQSLEKFEIQVQKNSRLSEHGASVVTLL